MGRGKPQRAAMCRNKLQCAATSCNKSIFVDCAPAAPQEQSDPKYQKTSPHVREKLRQIEALKVHYCARTFIRVTVRIIIRVFIRVFIRVTYPRHLCASLMRVTYPRHLSASISSAPLTRATLSASKVCAIYPPVDLSASFITHLHHISASIIRNRVVSASIISLPARFCLY